MISSISGKRISLYLWLLGLLSFTSLLYVVFDSDAILFCAWIALCLVLFTNRLDFFIKYIHYLFFLSLNFIGIFAIENAYFYLSELKTYSADFDALFPAFVIHFVFLGLVLLFDDCISNKRIINKAILFIKYHNNNIVETATVALGVIFLALSLYLLFNAVRHPAFASGYDRFEYAKLYITGAWDTANKLSGWLLPIVPLLLIYKKNKFGILSLIVYSAYLFLIGNKFGAFFNIFVLLTPYIVVRFNLKEISQKTLLIAAAAIMGVGLLLLTILFVFHKLTYGYDLDEFLVYLGERLAQQGQMWWAVYGKCKMVPAHINEIEDELIGFWGLDQTTPDKMNYGIYKMMQLVTPYDTYASKILSGSRYTTSTCASIYYYTKYWGFIVVLPMAAAVLSYVVNWYWRALYNREIIGTIVSWVIIGRLATIYSMSEFQMVFNLKYMIVIVFAIAIDKYLAIRNSKSEYAPEGV